MAATTELLYRMVVRRCGRKKSPTAAHNADQARRAEPEGHRLVQRVVDASDDATLDDTVVGTVTEALSILHVWWA